MLAMRPPRARLLRAASVLILIGAAWAAFTFRISSEMPDFDVYWRAAERALLGESLYRAEDGHYQFKYLPAFAVVVSPLRLVGEDAARALWFILSLGALAALVTLSLRLWPDRSFSTALLAVLVIIVLGKFMARELLLGQANAVFGAVMAGSIVALSHGRERLGGALTGVGIVLKPYAVIFLPWILLRGRIGSIGAAAVTLAVALCLPILRYSPQRAIALHQQWWVTVRDSTEPNLLNPDNASWLAMYTRVFGAGGEARVAWLVTMLLVVLLLSWLWTQRRRVQAPERLEGAVLLMLVPLVSPQGWDYVLLLAAPAVVGLLVYQRRLPGWIRAPSLVALAVIGLTIYDVMGRDAYRAFMMASGLTICVMVVLGALAVLRLREVV
jgi:hypothetical protein